MNDNFLIFLLETDCFHKPLYNKTAEHKNIRNKKIIVKNVLGSFYFYEKL